MSQQQIKPKLNKTKIVFPSIIPCTKQYKNTTEVRLFKQPDTEILSISSILNIKHKSKQNHTRGTTMYRDNVLQKSALWAHDNALQRTDMLLIGLHKFANHQHQDVYW